jgi:hypothetical protein
MTHPQVVPKCGFQKNKNKKSFILPLHLVTLGRLTFGKKKILNFFFVLRCLFLKLKEVFKER